MSDATREQAIQWCRDNRCNFTDPVFPPPSGWMWAENGNHLVLAPIFTMTDQGGEIRAEDVAANDKQSGGEE